MTIVSYLSHSYYGFFIVFSLKNPSISIHLKAEIIYFFFFIVLVTLNQKF